MPPEITLLSDADQQIDEAVLCYLRGLELGAPDRQRALTDYPHAAADLVAFFEDLDQVDNGLAAVRALATAVDERLASFGDYVVGDQIGWGGNGVVYKAWQVSLQRPLAIKVLRDRHRIEAEEAQRILTEAQEQANLDHPHIVPIYDVGSHDGLPYYSMKLMEGGNLATRQSDFQLPAGERGKSLCRGRQAMIARLLATVAEAVHHAHQRGLLHRDLKPGNILLDGEDRPHVTDFGLAIRVAAAGADNGPVGIAGTPSYMAPEQAAGGKGLTTAVDVYGLGAVLYELLTGQPPFRGADWNDTLEQVKKQQPLPPRQLQAAAHADLEAICLKCLKKNPAERYAGAGELARDLRRFLAGKPVAARPVSAMQRALMWARRKPAVALLTAAILFVSVLGGALVVWKWRQAVTALDESAHSLYGRRIPLAERLLASGNRSRAEQELDLCPEPLRHWEWHFLKRWCQPETIATLSGYEGSVVSIAFSPAGDKLATAGTDGTFRLWPADGGGGSQVLGRHSCGLKEVVFSPDGQQVAWAADDGTVKVWDLAKSQQVMSTPPQAGTAVAFHPDGKLVATAGPGKRAKLWDIAKGTMHYSLEHNGAVLCLGFSADGQWLVLGGLGDGPLTAWNMTTRQRGAPFPKALETRARAQDWIGAVAFRRDIGLVATPRQAWVWDPDKTDNLTELLGFAGRCTSVVVSADGRHAAASFPQGTVMVWDATTGKPLYTSRQQLRKPNCVALSPSGRLLAVARGNTVTVESWQDRSGYRELRCQAPLQPARALAFSLDGKLLASAENQHTVVVRDMDNDRLQRFEGHTAPIRSVAFRHDGKLLASASADQTIALWDLVAGKRRVRLAGHSAAVNAVAFSPDGEQLASASDDHTIRLWEAANGNPLTILADHKDDVTSLAFSPQGRLLASGGRDWTVKIWDVPKRSVLLTLDQGQQVQNVCFSADGRWLASASADQSIKIWDTANGKPVRTLCGHTGTVVAAIFSPDSKRLFSASHDGTLRTWDTGTGQELLSLMSLPQGITGLAATSDGQLLATGNRDGSVKIWDGRPLNDGHTQSKVVRK
jgi:WD40 repeat protein